MSDKQQVLHRAEEHGQSRELKTSEIKATTAMAAIESLALASAAGIAVVTVQGIQGHDIGVWTALATGGVVGGLSFYFHVAQNFGQLREGLRAWRSVETFAPQPEPEPAKPWRPPIPVFSKGDVQLMDVNERPALPAPPEQRALTPMAVLEILGASLENQGSFSRRTITRLRLTDGRKVTRGMWQEAAAWLHQVGILRRDLKGSYCLPNEIQNFDDLYIQLPGLRRLERAGLDRARAGPGTGIAQLTRAVGGEVGTLAERRRRRWLECGCDVKRYLEG